MADMQSAREQAQASLPGPDEGGSVYAKQQELELLMLTCQFYLIAVLDEIQEVQAETQSLLADQKTALSDLRAITAEVNKIMAAQVQADVELQQILAAQTPPTVGSILFGWGGAIQSYPVSTNEVIQMSDVSFPVNSSGESGTLTVLDTSGEAFTPAAADISWTESSSGSVITLTVAADGMSATAAPVAVGTSTVTINVVNADGTAVPPFTSTVTVTAQDAASLSVAWSPITQAPAPSA